jgi:hypothetical protein
MIKNNQSQKDSPANKAAKSLLLLHTPIEKIKIPTSSSTVVTTALLLHRQFNLKDNNDERDYPIEILYTFFVGKKRMALVNFVGYSTNYDRIIPVSRLRNFIG